VLLLVTLIPRAYMWYLDGQAIVVNMQDMENRIETIEGNTHKRMEKKKKAKKNKFRTPPSIFNPNEYELADWMKLGLSEKQAKVIINFKEKRPLKSNDDLQHIFVVSEELFALLKDSTVYSTATPFVAQDKTAPITKRFDLNTASAEELISLPGIGAYYAKKIVEYREKLGGYTNREQLLELYKFDVDKLQRIDDRIEVKNGIIRQININTCTVSQLKEHPYFDWNLANSIVKIRQLHGEYTAVEQIQKSHLITVDILQKIKPYLTVQD